MGFYKDPWQTKDDWTIMGVLGIVVLISFLGAAGMWMLSIDMTKGAPVQSTSAVDVQKVTEFDGVTLYRVFVDGHYVYVAKSAEKVQTSWNTMLGKITTYQTVETVK